VLTEDSLELKGFRTSSIVQILKNQKKKTRRFGNWICFRPQVRGDIYSVGSLDQVQWLERANLDQDKNTTFRKLDLFPSSGEWRHLLCWVPGPGTQQSRCLPSREDGNRSWPHSVNNFSGSSLDIWRLSLASRHFIQHILQDLVYALSLLFRISMLNPRFCCCLCLLWKSVCKKLKRWKGKTATSQVSSSKR
jgi:hypothetical protein